MASEGATKLTLADIFMGGLATFTALLRHGEEEPEFRPLDLLVLGLATYRTGRLVAFERVAAPLREPVSKTVPDASGAGEAVVAAGTGWRWTLGELLSCPTCIGTWVATGLVYGMRLAPRPTKVFATIMGITGVAQLLSEATEALTWSSRSARQRAAPIRGV